MTRQSILKSFKKDNWSKDWEEADERSPEERFKSVKAIALRMGCLSDDPDTINSFMKYHFKDKHRSKENGTQQ